MPDYFRTRGFQQDFHLLLKHFRDLTDAVNRLADQAETKNEGAANETAVVAKAHKLWNAAGADRLRFKRPVVAREFDAPIKEVYLAGTDLVAINTDDEHETVMGFPTRGVHDVYVSEGTLDLFLKAIDR